MKSIPLTKGMWAIVDDDDFERVVQFRWHTISRNGKPAYAARHYRRTDGSRGLQYLHKFIMRSEMLHDHENGNGFDCRKDNLRPATTKQNLRNRRAKSTSTSPFKGICFHDNGWEAKVVADGKTIYIGRSSTPEEAARLYDKGAIKFHGDFARLNFSRSYYPADPEEIILPKKMNASDSMSHAAKTRWARYRGEPEPKRSTA